MSLRELVFKRVVLRILAALAVVYALLQVLDLLEVTTEILDRNQGVAGIAYYALLRSPRLILQALPIAVLAGGLFAFSQLARERAVTAMRAVGVSVYSVVTWAMPAALLIILFQFALDQWIKPAADTAFQQWWEATKPPSEAVGTGSARTFRVGSEIVTANASPAGDGYLANLRIYRRDQDGRLTQRIVAESARFNGTAWTLMNVRTVTIGEIRAETGAAPTLDWITTLRPEDVAGALGDTVDVSPAEARRALGEGAALRTAAFYEMRLQRAWAAPIGSLVMLLLAAPVAMANFRGGSGSTTMAAVLAAGMLFLVMDGLLAALGESGAIPVILGAWAAPCIFAAIGLTVLLYQEG